MGGTDSNQKRLRLGAIRTTAAAAFAATVLAGAALGATGQLTSRGCIDDVGAGPDTCALSAKGLQLPVSVAVSPDGKSVYVTSVGGDAIVSFGRNRKTGALKRKGCTGNTHTSDCPKLTPGIDGAAAVVVSRDGKSVYVAGAESDSIAHFKRNRKTGALRPRGCIDDIGGPDLCGLASPGLDGAYSLAISPDGRSLYAGSDGAAVVRFRRSRQTGRLRLGGCIADVDRGPAECAQTAPSLDYVYGLAVSPDGRALYATSYEGNALARFKRNKKTGALRPRGCVEDKHLGRDQCATKADGLSGALSVALSPNGKSVYVAGERDHAVAHLKRNAKTGALTARGCVQDDTATETCAKIAQGLATVSGVATSSDGKSVYASGLNDDAVVHLRRQRRSGSIAPRGCVHDHTTGTGGCSRTAPGLDYPQDVTVSADGRSVYAVSYLDSAIVRLKRTR